MNNLETVRRQIQKADILLTRDKDSAISTVISGVTHSYWSHTVLYIGDNKIIDTVSDGVKIRALDDYLDGSYGIGLFRYKDGLSREQQNLVVETGRELLGLKYAWWQLWWDFILRLLGKSEDKDWAVDMSTGMVCSEFVARAYEAIGIKFKNIPAYQMEPVDFDESPFTVRIA